MDFIVRLPPTVKNHDSIWVIVDRLTKSAHFIPVQADYRPTNYVELYFNQIVWLHGIPRTIISDRGPQFTTHFWELAPSFRDQASEKLRLSPPNVRSDWMS
jgi:hypothetical protein